MRVYSQHHLTDRSTSLSACGHKTRLCFVQIYAILHLKVGDVMKKLVSIIICLTIFLSLDACDSNEKSLSFDTNGDIHISLPDVGLENVILCEASERGVWIERSVCGQVFLLGQYKNNDNVMMDHFLVIVTEDKTFCKNLTAYEGQLNFAGNIELCDFDGDGDCEILLQQTVGMTSGAGSYLSRIFDYRDGEMLEILSSDSIFNKYSKNMGFSCTLLKNKEIRIENEFTDYSETFSMSDRPDEYFKWWYNDDDSIAEQELLIDSFYEFMPIDTDFDGVYEVFCRQYTSLIGHFDGIGCTKIVLKYNETAAEFEIIDASFELYKYES